MKKILIRPILGAEEPEPEPKWIKRSEPEPEPESYDSFMPSAEHNGKENVFKSFSRKSPKLF